MEAVPLDASQNRSIVVFEPLPDAAGRETEAGGHLKAISGTAR